MAGTLKAWYPNHIHMTFDVRSRDLWPRDESRSLVSILLGSVAVLLKHYGTYAHYTEFVSIKEVLSRTL